MVLRFTSRRLRMSEAARSSQREPTKTWAMELPARENAATRSGLEEDIWELCVCVLCA
jgi:hypothetical protein